MPKIDQFGKYQVSIGTDGSPIELWRTSDEVACLGFDTKAGHLVELRVLTGGELFDDARKLSFRQRVRSAMELRGECVTRVTDEGFDDGMLYYAVEFTDGERLGEYVERRGSVYASLALDLTLQLVDALIELQTYPRLLLNVDLSNVMVFLWEDAYLRLRINDYGLARAEPDLGADHDLQRPIEEVGRILFSLVVGRPFQGAGDEGLDSISNLPSNLKYLLRQILTRSSRAPTSLEGLGRELRSGLGAVSDRITFGDGHERQPVDSALSPRFCLFERLLREADMERIIGEKYQIKRGSSKGASPYAERVGDPVSGGHLNLQILPPNRVVSQEFYTPVQLRMWKSDPQQHRHLLRTLNVWETGEFTFIAEESPEGFPLSRLLATRGTLTPMESLIILREVWRGIEEADECGVEIRNLHPANVMIGFPDGTTLRRRDEYLEKRVDAWPEFVGSLRTHFTMRSLVEPPLSSGVNGLESDSEGGYLKALSRAYVALSSLMMSGFAFRPASAGVLSGDLVDYLEESLERSETEVGGIQIKEFFEGLEARVAGEMPEERGLAGKGKPVELSSVVRITRAGLPGEESEPQESVEMRPVGDDGPLLVSRAENPEEFDRRQKQLSRSIRLLDVGAGGDVRTSARTSGLIWAGIALLLGLVVYGLTRFRGEGGESGLGLSSAEEHRAATENENGPGNLENVATSRRPPPEVTRPAIIPGEGDEPPELYDD